MTDIDTTRIRELLDKRDAIDVELATIIGGQQIKKQITCSSCQQSGHTARTCPSKVQS